MGSGKNQRGADGLGVVLQRYARGLLGQRQFRQSLRGLNLTPMSSSNQKNVIVRLVPVPDKRGSPFQESACREVAAVSTTTVAQWQLDRVAFGTVQSSYN